MRRVWSLLLGGLAIGVAWMFVGNGSARADFQSGSITPGNPTAAGRIALNGTASGCLSPKSSPGLVDTSARHFHTVEIAGSPGACVIVTLSHETGTPVVATAYSAFDPTNPAANYLADGGAAATSGNPVAFSFQLPASGRATIAVTERDNAGQVSDYILDFVNASFAADIGLAKTDSVDPVVPGSNLTYTITATNNGPNDFATPIDIDDPLPAGTTFVSETHAFGWTCTAPTVGSGGTYHCNGAMFSSSPTSTFTVTVHVDPSVTAPLSNTVTSTYRGDRNSANNTATETTNVAPSANLTITKSDAPDPVTAGNNITYTITAANSGPSAAATVVLSDAVPAGTTFASLASPSGWTCPTPPAVGATGTIQCNRASLAPLDGPQVFTLTVKVNADVPAGTAITNTATLTSPTPDPSTPNTATAMTATAVSADVALQKSCPTGPVVPGDQFTCTLTVTNNGPSDAQNVVVTDDLPAGVTLVGTPSGGGFTCGTGDPFTCTRMTLSAASGPQVVTFTVRVNDDVAGGTVLKNDASVGTATFDPDTGNNSASASTALPACTIDRTSATSGQVIRGTNGPDVICGSAFADTIQGLDGDDIIFGNGGNDSIQGNGGNDKQFGGAGDDAITGPPGIDAANGGSGFDRCMSRANTNCEQAQVA